MGNNRIIQFTSNRKSSESYTLEHLILGYKKEYASVMDNKDHCIDFFKDMLDNEDLGVCYCIVAVIEADNTIRTKGFLSPYILYNESLLEKAKAVGLTDVEVRMAGQTYNLLTEERNPEAKDNNTVLASFNEVSAFRTWIVDKCADKFLPFNPDIEKFIHDEEYDEDRSCILFKDYKHRVGILAERGIHIDYGPADVNSDGGTSAIKTVLDSNDVFGDKDTKQVISESTKHHTGIYVNLDIAYGNVSSDVLGHIDIQDALGFVNPFPYNNYAIIPAVYTLVFNDGYKYIFNRKTRMETCVYEHGNTEHPECAMNGIIRSTMFDDSASDGSDHDDYYGIGTLRAEEIEERVTELGYSQ